MIARAVTVAASRAGGWLAARRLPTPLRAAAWGAFARLYGANTAEAAGDLAAFPDFQSFFTRALKDGARRIDPSPHVWTSPVDAWWLSHERVDDGAFVPVKGNRHAVAELLRDRELAGAFADGFVSTFYLRPGDYHRIHSPCDMRIVEIRGCPGALLPVNRFGQRVDRVFCRNERWILAGETDRGPAAMVWVGALMVGSMAFSHPGLAGRRPTAHSTGIGVDVAKGEELGMFRFGSTVVLFGPKFRNPVAAPPVEVRVGTRIVAWKDVP